MQYSRLAENAVLIKASFFTGQTEFVQEMENKTVKMYQQQSDLYGHDEGKSMSHFHENADTRSAAEVAEAQLLPCESEKKHILLMFNTMRKESFFCDVAFICHGVLFRAHRVVVSSWSRWLRALLCESPDEEVVALDFFEPDAFGAALDYMYGVPLIMNVEVVIYYSCL